MESEYRIKEKCRTPKSDFTQTEDSAARKQGKTREAVRAGKIRSCARHEKGIINGKDTKRILR